MKNYLKIYKSSIANARVSLDQPIQIQDLLGNIKNDQSRNNAEPLAVYTSLYFWDLGSRATEHVHAGDRVYIVTKNRLYHGVIDIHIHDAPGGIGDAIGWNRQFKRPWRNPVGLGTIEKSKITPAMQRRIEDAVSSAAKVASSFYSIQGEWLENDSPPDDQETPHPAPDGKQSTTPGLGEALPDVEDPSAMVDLGSLKNRVRQLKNSEHHSERQHESLVERFFEYLGYQSPSDIQFRVGHIDIMVNPESTNSMVVEVKRDWALSRNNSDVVNQAYRYAMNRGSRFVIITNGDYYAFYDRLRGLSISDNFDFEFNVSTITGNDIELLKKYRKTSL